MTVRSRGAHTPETITQLLKTRINTGEIKVGVNTLKSSNGGVLIETNSKEEIEVLDKENQAKCGDELDAHNHTSKRPRLIILNVPEDISINIEVSILRKSPDLILKKGNIAAKFTFVTKNMYCNAFLKMAADTRNSLLHRKIELRWQICKIQDYLVANRCFKYCKFNHRTQDCRGEVTYPLCACPHTLKLYSGDSKEFKCTKCAKYNKHNSTKIISIAHSSLERKCPNRHAVKRNTD